MKLVILLAVAGLGQAADNSQVQKVIQLLKDLQKKTLTEMDAEEVAFTKFSEWCRVTENDRSKQIQDGKDESEQLQATIDESKSKIADLSQEIEDLVNKLANADMDMKNRNSDREKAKAEYEAEHADLSESVDALTRALVVLKKRERGSVAQASLTQVSNLPSITPEVKGMIAAFLDDKQDDDFMDRKNPQAAAYESHSDGIIGMLEKLQAEFEDQRNKVVKAEMNAKHSHDMAIQDLTGTVAEGKKVKARQSQLLESTQKTLGQAEGDLTSTQQELAADEAYLGEMNAMCKKKADEYPVRRELRMGEQTAINKAVEILSSKLGLVQTSLLQVSSLEPNQSDAIHFLFKQAQKLHSDNLSQLAEKMADDPFKKVKKMIFDMINKLKNQANEEAEHKGWCDGEMQTNAQVRQDKEIEVDKLVSEVDSLSSEVSKLTEDLAELEKGIAENQAAQEEATIKRKEENRRNIRSIRDAKDAQLAVSEATQVLKEFYEKAKGAMLTQIEAEAQQDPSEDAPEIFESSNPIGQDSAGGIVGFLDVINQDFAQAEAETEAAEADAQNEYDKFMSTSKRDLAVAERTRDNKTKRKEEAALTLTQTEADLRNSEEELGAANRYHQKLIPSCVHKPMSYEEKVAKREAEIQSLKEALRILEDTQTD